MTYRMRLNEIRGSLNAVSTTLISLLIPTYNRYDALELTLRGYAAQNVAADQFEIVVISDGPEFVEPTRRVIESFPALRVRHLQSGRSGPGGARNLALADHAPLAPLILITGDDIIPDPDYVAAHLDFHHRNPADTAGAVGLTRAYAPDGKLTDFMEWLDTETDIQFGYHTLAPAQKVSFKYFYTSNVSLKKKMIAGELFDLAFRHGGWEDMDMGYRLQKKGFELTYLPAAVGRHNHVYEPRDYYRRSRIMGWYEMMFYSKHPELPAPSVLRDQAAGFYHLMRMIFFRTARAQYRSRAALARLAGHAAHRRNLAPE